VLFLSYFVIGLLVYFMYYVFVRLLSCVFLCWLCYWYFFFFFFVFVRLRPPCVVCNSHSLHIFSHIVRDSEVLGLGGGGGEWGGGGGGVVGGVLLGDYSTLSGMVSKS